MSHTLVTLLGKAVENYSEANYAFSPDTLKTARFFGLELCKQIDPTKLVILGTTGSMWDNLLLENNLPEDELDDDFWELSQNARNDCVTQDTLDRLVIHLENVLNVKCELRLIPYGRNAQEQTDILNILVDSFKPNDSATLDVTHGLRHLSMLVKQSALLLETAKNVTIKNIYYAALDLTKESITPVMKLDGLLQLDRWNRAIDIYDKSGEYGVFSDILLDAGFKAETVEYLKNASFYEQSNRLSSATGQIREFLSVAPDEINNCDAFAQIFMPTLLERLNWVNEKKLYLRQAEVARLALQHENFIRACIYGYEAYLTYLIQLENKNPDKFEDRQWITSPRTNMAEKLTRRMGKSVESFKLLRHIRNQVAHNSTSPTADVQRAVSSRQTLKITLETIFDELLPKSCNN